MWIKVEIKRDDKHIDAPNYQVREIRLIVLDTTVICNVFADFLSSDFASLL